MILRSELNANRDNLGWLENLKDRKVERCLRKRYKRELFENLNLEGETNFQTGRERF